MVDFAVSLSVEENGRKSPEYTLDTDLDGRISLEDLLKFTKASLLIIADQTLTEEQAAGFDEKPVLVVDGSKNKPIENVSPLGQIEFVARVQINSLLLDAYQGILDRSKVLTGRYKGSHYVFFNGQQIATDLTSLETWLKNPPAIGDGDLIRIVNIQPYARRLEMLGVTAQRSKQSSTRRKGRTNYVRVPNGVYQLTTRALRSKYKQNVGIKFSFISGSFLGLTGSFKRGRSGRNSSGRPYLYPTIVFSISERGIL